MSATLDPATPRPATNPRQTHTALQSKLLITHDRPARSLPADIRLSHLHLSLPAAAALSHILPSPWQAKTATMTFSYDPTSAPAVFLSNTCTTDQASSDRRLGCWQVMLSVAIQRGQLHPVIHHHHRHRLQDPHHRARQQARQAANLGHGWPGTLPHHYHRLLPRRHGHSARLRRDGREELQQCVAIYTTPLPLVPHTNHPRQQTSAPGSQTSNNTPPKASTKSSSATSATGKKSAPSAQPKAKPWPTSSAFPSSKSPQSQTSM